MKTISAISIVALVAATAAPTASASQQLAGNSAFAPRSKARVPPMAANTRNVVLPQKKQEDGSAIATATAEESSKMEILRGGEAAAGPSQAKVVGGILFFIALERSIEKLLAAKNSDFPPMLAGTITCFTTMLLAHIFLGKGDAIFNLVSPGANLLAKWLPAFFVPGLATLPLAPSVGSPVEAVKLLSVVVVGFFFTITTVTYTVLSLRTAMGAISKDPEAKPDKPKKLPKTQKLSDKAAAAAPPAKPYSAEILDFYTKTGVVFLAISVWATRTNFEYATPIRCVAMFCTSLASFIFGARLPTSFTKVVHPLWMSTFGTLAVTQLLALATGSTFLDVLETYRVSSLAPMKAGAGDYLLYLLAPAVASLSVAMYSRKALIRENFLVVVVAMLVSAIGGLFGTASFVRLINLGGTTSTFLRKSVLSRNVTTALAIAITNMFGGSMQIAAVSVILTGILGATVARLVLDALGVTDPISRGLGVGASSQGLGVASLVSEKDAFPFAAISMILTAVCATTLVSFPSVRNLLLDIALGASEKVAETVSQ